MSPSPSLWRSPQAPRRGVAVVVVREDRLLVIRRSANVAAPGMFCFPGGRIEAGEGEAGTVVREMLEELGAAVKPVRLLWRSVTPWQVELAWWLAEMKAEAELVANLAEVESIHWFTPDEMLALPELLESNRQFLESLQRGEFSLEST